MTLFQLFVTYVTCWWLVLFMVLPHQADAPPQPGLGHAPSAPANPQLKKKFKWTTVLAIIPAALIYLVITEARADEIYHVGGGCAPVETHAAADVNATDGVGANGKTVAPATMGGDSAIGNMDHYDIPLELPSAKYANGAAATPAAASTGTSAATPAATTSANGATQTAASTNVHNVDLSQSFINMGKLSIGRDGSSTLNGKPIASQTASGCNP